MLGICSPCLLSCLSTPYVSVHLPRSISLSICSGCTPENMDIGDDKYGDFDRGRARLGALLFPPLSFPVCTPERLLSTGGPQEESRRCPLYTQACVYSDQPFFTPSPADREEERRLEGDEETENSAPLDFRFFALPPPQFLSLSLEVFRLIPSSAPDS